MRRVARVAELDAAGVVDEAIDEPVVRPFRGDDPFRRGAGLAGVEERGGADRGDRPFRVRIVEDDDRPVATELHHELLARCQPRDGGADGARAGEPDDDDALVLDERRRHLDGRSGQQAEQALGDARFDDALGEQRRDAGGRRCRLEDDRVAAGQRRPDVFDRDVHREVPRRDRHDDAARLAERHHPLARVLDRDRLAGQPARLGGGEPEAAGRRADLPERLGQGLAVLDDEVVGDARRDGAR